MRTTPSVETLLQALGTVDLEETLITQGLSAASECPGLDS